LRILYYQPGNFSSIVTRLGLPGNAAPGSCWAPAFRRKAQPAAVKRAFMPKLTTRLKDRFRVVKSDDPELMPRCRFLKAALDFFERLAD
jgi:hypothetical protein